MSQIQMLVLIDLKKMGFSIFLLTCPPPLPGSQRWNKNGQITWARGHSRGFLCCQSQWTCIDVPQASDWLRHCHGFKVKVREPTRMSPFQAIRALEICYRHTYTLHTLWQSHSQSKVAITKNRSININSCQTAFLEIYRGQALTQPGNFQWF